MLRKLVLSSVIAFIPALAFAADTTASAPAAGAAVTHPAAAAAKTETTVKADTAKTDVIKADAKTDTSVKADAAKTDSKVAAKGHKVVHKTKAKVMPKPEATKS